ncbi:transcriptional adapter ADA2a-like isoform X1 [Cucurbita pepo subsp. pepo]|uniref:transcriptional adapter ADA2a-like isoform X1 n=1 Tax=Cucurbita pepo subsp. pepo TaxID=3664 RepID=UPI000C9D6F4B|nr:transcriptional adapter ADA2a-like isoform X1 [Cucurbita pepo subsp. pepo]
MGRSRMVSRPEDEDPNQSKSKRKRPSSTEATNQATVGQESRDGKVALYHCNYCNKDLSGRIRMKCVACPDYDLCVECFSVGAELTPHKSNHPYRVMDNLSFPLLCPDWHADEESLLLEGIAVYGFGNWDGVAEHVGTKSKLQCLNHYNAMYMNSPCFPLPDLSHVKGKSREELLAMATVPGEVKKEFPMVGEHNLNEGSSLSARVKCEESKKEDSAHQTSSSGTAGSISGSTFSGAVKKSNKPQIKDEIKQGESEADRSFSEKKPRVLGDSGPSVVELSGYNFKRKEFDIEYDNDAEHLLADMEFKDTDSAADHELKLRILRIYSKRLDERKRRKEFILDRDLLYSDPFEKHLSPEERAICQPYKVFMRFHSKEDHEELLKNLIEEHRIVKRIQELQEARAAGCRTIVESNRFLDQKRKETRDSSKRVKENSRAVPSDVSNHLKGEHDDNPRGSVKESPRSQGSGKEPSPATTWISSSIHDWDISGFAGADLLSEMERRLCCEIRILPAHYLKMVDIISVEMLKGSVTKKSDVHGLFKVDPSKVDRVYEMVVKKGIAQA